MEQTDEAETRRDLIHLLPRVHAPKVGYDVAELSSFSGIRALRLKFIVILQKYC
jgi:hypothetical protein